MTSGDWHLAEPDEITLGEVIKQFCRYRGLDVRSGVIMLTLGDPEVSVQYFGPNRVSHERVVEYVVAIAETLIDPDVVVRIVQ